MAKKENSSSSAFKEQPSEARYKAIVDNQLEIVTCYRPEDYVITFINPAGCRYYGKSEAELIGTSLLELVDKENIELIEACVVELVSQKEAQRKALKTTGPDGQPRWHICTYIPILDNSGTVVEIQSSVTDITAQKIAEQTLFENEQRYRAIVNSQTDRVVRYRVNDYTISFVNPAFCCFFDKNEAELIGMNAMSLIANEDARAHTKLTVAKVIKSKETLVTEGRNVQPTDGKLYWFRRTTVPIFDEQGQVVEIQQAEIDITQRKEMELALEATSKQLQLIADNIPAWVVLIDRNYRFRFVNSTYANQHNVPPDSIVGQFVWDLTRQEEFERYKPYYDLAMSGEHVSFETSRTLSNGQISYSQFDLVPYIVNDQIEGFIALVSDITERKQNEQALEEASRQLRLIADNVPARISYIDREQRVQFANRQYELLTKLPLEQIINCPVRDLIGPERYEKAKPNIKTVLSGQPISFEIEVSPLKDGKFHHELVTFIPEIVEDEVPGYFAMVVDITDLKVAQSQINALNEELRQANTLLEKRVLERTAQLETANTSLQKNIEHLQALNKITSAPESTFTEKVEQLLNLGCEWFELPIGVFSHIDGDHYRIVQAVSPDNVISANDEFPLGDTYCSIMLESGQATGFEQMSKTEWRTHRAFVAYGLEAYLGVEVRIAGQIYGTLCFSDLEPRSRSFEETDKELLKLMGQWIGTELERKEAEEQLLSFIESAPDAIIVSNKQGKIVLINRQTKRLFGYSLEELMGQSIEILVPERLRHGHVYHRAEYYKNPEIRPMGKSSEVLGLRKDGSKFPAEISLSPVYTAEGNTLTISSVRDITERVEARNVLAKHAQELARSNADLDHFATIAAHDLKEPLRGLRNYGTMLAEQYGDQFGDTGQSHLESMLKLTGQAIDLIDDLRIYSRVGLTDTAPQYVDVDAVVDDVLGRIQTLLDERKVEIRRPHPLPKVHYNRAHIQTIFQNLIANAATYNDKDKKWVEIGVASTENLIDSETLLDSADTPVFYISDNGIGIRARHHQRIFDMFKRLHPQRYYSGGTGAGLALVKKIIEQNGGQIWLASTPHKGTTFYFKLSAT